MQQSKVPPGFPVSSLPHLANTMCSSRLYKFLVLPIWELVSVILTIRASSEKLKRVQEFAAKVATRQWRQSCSISVQAAWMADSPDKTWTGKALCQPVNTTRRVPYPPNVFSPYLSSSVWQNFTPAVLTLCENRLSLWMCLYQLYATAGHRR